MTQRNQYRLHHALSGAMKAYTYTPGTPDATAMLNRLATKAQMTAAEFGEELTWEDARKRAAENLAWARTMIARAAA